MMSVLMGVRSQDALARACDLGVAMQLTNIARDVGEDARNGRLYLPRDWFREAGIDADAWMQAPQLSPAIITMTQRLLLEADSLYRRGGAGISLLPSDTRHAIWAARFIYAEIGAQIKRNDMDNVTRRAIVSKPRKLALLSRAYVAPLIASSRKSFECLSEAHELVMACGEQMRLRPKMSFIARVSWVIDLMERIESARLEDAKRARQ
jgi:phytoene synthase